MTRPPGPPPALPGPCSMLLIRQWSRTAARAQIGSAEPTFDPMPARINPAPPRLQKGAAEVQNNAAVFNVTD